MQFENIYGMKMQWHIELGIQKILEPNKQAVEFEYDHDWLFMLLEMFYGLKNCFVR